MLMVAKPHVPGPSPRVRGSPGPEPLPSTRVRSIPACAGEPRSGRPGDKP